MKIAIIGFNIEGQASYEYFVGQGHELVIHDQNTDVQVPDGASSVLGETYLDNLDGYDLLVRTAGINPRLILDRNPGVKDKITTHVNEFFKVSPTKNIIGVTGTKGKGTTSTLIAKMLEAADKDVKLGGNIGLPPLTFLNKLSNDSWVVLEMSSFQLIDLQASSHIAVCLMVVPEHLDWHPDINEYTNAKSQLFVHQTADDTAIYFNGNELSQLIASHSPGQKLPYFAPPGANVIDGVIQIDGHDICKTDELKLLGQHNWQNACAAVTAAWQVTQNIDAIRSVLTSFSGLPHRIEFVRELDGIRYYNDSYATGLHATIAAIEAVPAKKVMILGGFERMINIDHFGEYVAKHMEEFRTILLIGASAQRLADTFSKAGFTNFSLDQSAQTMEDIVAKSRSLAKTGDAVILSPGFASFDMFKNFEDRGSQFKVAVNKL